MLPITFVTTRVLEPEFFASFNAANVSAVSPDWVIPITRDFSFLVPKYLYSEASSTMTGIPVSCSIIYLPTRPE